MRQPGIFLITGASRGIGAATAKLASKSYPVAFFYRRNTAQAAQVVDEIRSAGGVAHMIQADVGDEESLMQGFAAVDELGRLEVLVNNAAVTGGSSRLQDVQASVLQEVFSVNVIGAFIACREAVKRMSLRHGGQGGSIVNVSSGASQLGAAHNWIHYAASKGALDTLTIGLSREVATEGIRVNAVRPGVINTEMQAGRSSEQMKKMLQVIPMERMGTPEEIAESILWLASAQASYVTGSFVDARGGL